MYTYMTADPLMYGKLRQYVKELRQKRPTEAETLLWQYIRGKALGAKFRRQHIIGPFIADFCCIETHLIIEVDGGYHQLPEQQISDQERQQALESWGYRVIRFTNEDILFDSVKTLDKIKQKIYDTEC